MIKNTLLSVIIVNFNQKYFPRLCVEALKKSKTRHSFEIIMVDNASQDESIAYLRQEAKNGTFTLIENSRNFGYGQANNLGAKHAKGQFLLFMNPDVSVSENSLETMVEYLQKHPEIGILGPKIVYHDGTIQPSCRRFMTFTDLIIKRTFLKRLPPFKERLRRYIMQDFNHHEIQEVELLTGACFLMKKEIFDRVFGFDKRYFLFMEDFDLCQKVHEAGLSVVYFPQVTVTHYHKRLSDGNMAKLLFQKPFWHHLISSAKYFWRWRGKSRKYSSRHHSRALREPQDAASG